MNRNRFFYRKQLSVDMISLALFSVLLRYYDAINVREKITASGWPKTSAFSCNTSAKL